MFSKVFVELTKEDMKEMGKNAYSLMASFTVAEYDKDGDGYLNKEEFLEAFSEISEWLKKLLE